MPPPKGPSQSDVWSKNSQLPGDHVVAGSFDTAMIVSVYMYVSVMYIVYIVCTYCMCIQNICDSICVCVCVQ